MASIRKIDCKCPRREKATCRHKPWKVTYREPGGRAGRVREASFKLRDDAEAFAVKVERDKDLGVYIDPKRGRRLFSDVWEEWVSIGDLEASTRANYASVYKNHFEPHFGKKAIGAITKEDIITWERDQKQRGYKEYGIETRRNILSSVFGYALDAEIIGRNPCKRANPRKSTRKTAYTPVTDEEIPSLEEVLGIIAEAPKRLRAALWAMAGSGVRPGEALAISDKSIDWEAGTLLVNHQVSAFGIEPLTGSKRGYKRGSKHRTFEEARRTPIPGPVRDALDEHIETFGTWGDQKWLFESPRRVDRHPTYDWLLRKFHEAAEAAGLPEYTPKSFRHFFVSEAIHADIPTWEIAQWVGHRDTRTTELIYGHLVKRAYTRGNQALGDALTRDLAQSHGKIPAPGLSEPELVAV